MNGTRYIDHGDHYICSHDGEVCVCSSCGKPKEYSKPGKKCCHKCSKKHESAKKAAATRNENGAHLLRKIPYGQKLLVGFQMLHNEAPRLRDQ